MDFKLYEKAVADAQSLRNLLETHSMGKHIKINLDEEEMYYLASYDVDFKEDKELPDCMAVLWLAIMNDYGERLTDIVRFVFNTSSRFALVLCNFEFETEEERETTEELGDLVDEVNEKSEKKMISLNEIYAYLKSLTPEEYAVYQKQFEKATQSLDNMKLKMPSTE